MNSKQSVQAGDVFVLKLFSEQCCLSLSTSRAMIQNFKLREVVLRENENLKNQYIQEYLDFSFIR